MTYINQYLEKKNKQKASSWFSELQNMICNILEDREAAFQMQNKNLKCAVEQFNRKKWKRPGGGGGEMSTMLGGQLFEKAGVNVSTVWGTFSNDFKKSVPGAESNPRFWASGISVVIHPRNPLIPAVHMNTRMVVTTKGWFGGGGDLTPTFPNDEETALFHNAYKEACDKYDRTCYPKFKKWCDEYFFLPHRQESRGVGGIFFDNLASGNWERDFQFIRDVGKTFLKIYPQIVDLKSNLQWSEEQKNAQLIKRGRYVEFNLLYDRGTLFGLKTGGNTEAILMSLPPEVAWT